MTDATPPRTIPVRRPGLEFDDSIPHHWLAGNAFATHSFNGMNLVFPDGERFFIQSVRDRMDRIDDPELRRQVKAFYGQEAHHAREHERYFEILEAQGYRIQGFLRAFRRYMRFTQRFLPAPLRLAITAGAEHYTASFGTFVLGKGLLMDAAHPIMRKLVLWHATEEIEHKSVAFDVLQATHPSHALRMVGFAIATASLFGWAAIGTRMLVRQDLEAGRIDRDTLARHRAELEARDAESAPMIRERVRAYRRRDFHPDETDDLALAHARLAELGIPVGNAA